MVTNKIFVEHFFCTRTCGKLSSRTTPRFGGVQSPCFLVEREERGLRLPHTRYTHSPLYDRIQYSSQALSRGAHPASSSSSQSLKVEASGKSSKGNKLRKTSLK